MMIEQLIDFFTHTSTTDEIDKWNYYTGQVTANVDASTSMRVVGFGNTGDATLNDIEYGLDDFYLINSTSIFGAGNEPSQTQMEAYFKDYITSRPKSSGIMKTREFSEIDTPNKPMKIFKDKIQIQGSIKEG